MDFIGKQENSKDAGESDCPTSAERRTPFPVLFENTLIGDLLKPYPRFCKYISVLEEEDIMSVDDLAAFEESDWQGVRSLGVTLGAIAFLKKAVKQYLSIQSTSGIGSPLNTSFTDQKVLRFTGTINMPSLDSSSGGQIVLDISSNITNIQTPASINLSKSNEKMTPCSIDINSEEEEEEILLIPTPEEKKESKHNSPRNDLIRSTSDSGSSFMKYRRSHTILSRNVGESISTYEKFKQTCTMGKELGRGQFAIVYECISRSTGQPLAVKVIEKDLIKSKVQTMEMLFDEVSIWKRVKHPNIIRILGVFDDKKFLRILLELAEGGELFENLEEVGHYTENDTRQIIKQVLLAVQYIHSKGIIHRDLKPENILLRKKGSLREIAISDFGLARLLNDDEYISKAVGTPTFIAPEIIKPQQYGVFGKESDMWSVGIITYLMLAGYPPFWHDDRFTLLRMICERKPLYPQSEWNRVTNEAIDFVESLLQKDPFCRMSADEALKHAWLTGESIHSAEIDLCVGTHIGRWSHLDQMGRQRGFSVSFSKSTAVLPSRFSLSVPKLKSNPLSNSKSSDNVNNDNNDDDKEGEKRNL